MGVFVGIDVSLENSAVCAVDEHGKRWLFLSEGYRIRLSDDGLSVVGEKEKIYDGWDYLPTWKTEGKFLESSKLLRRDGWFYTISAQGGTAGPATSHMVITGRSRFLECSRGPSRLAA